LERVAPPATSSFSAKRRQLANTADDITSKHSYFSLTTPEEETVKNQTNCCEVGKHKGFRQATKKLHDTMQKLESLLRSIREKSKWMTMC